MANVFHKLWGWSRVLAISEELESSLCLWSGINTKHTEDKTDRHITHWSRDLKASLRYREVWQHTDGGPKVKYVLLYIWALAMTSNMDWNPNIRNINSNCQSPWESWAWLHIPHIHTQGNVSFKCNSFHHSWFIFIISLIKEIKSRKSCFLPLLSAESF